MTTPRFSLDAPWKKKVGDFAFLYIVEILSHSIEFDNIEKERVKFILM
jgi:hypothetical protein